MRIFLSAAFNCLFIFSCQLKEKTGQKQLSPEGYNLATPKKINLPEELDEISGIIYNADSDKITSLNDEEGVLYRFKTDSVNHYEDSRFHKGADFEDLASVGPYWYALKSNGTLYKISNAFTDSVETIHFALPLKGKHEFEAILYDSPANRIIVFCKVCNKKPAMAPEAFAFDLTTEKYNPEPAFKIAISATHSNIISKKNNSIQISGAAVHPQSGKWWLIASVSGLLLITDNNGNVQDVFKLNRKKFKQPEGITFSPNGDLYISNEAKAGIANILIFRQTNQ